MLQIQQNIVPTYLENNLHLILLLSTLSKTLLFLFFHIPYVNLRDSASYINYIKYLNMRSRNEYLD